MADTPDHIPHLKYIFIDKTTHKPSVIPRDVILKIKDYTPKHQPPENKAG